VSFLIGSHLLMGRQIPSGNLITSKNITMVVRTAARVWDGTVLLVVPLALLSIIRHQGLVKLATGQWAIAQQII
jgi:hypothetical protein